MNIIFLLLAISIIIALLFLIGFIWSVKSGQYDDSYTPAVRILFDNPVQGDSALPSEKEHEQSGSET